MNDGSPGRSASATLAARIARRVRAQPELICVPFMFVVIFGGWEW